MITMNLTTLVTEMRNKSAHGTWSDWRRQS